MSKQKSGRRKLGNVVAIPLGDGTLGYGRVLREPLMAFYDLRTTAIEDVTTVVRAPVAFQVWVMYSAFRDGTWQVIGNLPLDAGLMEEPLFFKEDPISGTLSIYRKDSSLPGGYEERPARREECEQLECAAVWSQNHIVDRLVDHFSGRRCRWGGKGRFRFEHR